MSLADWSLDPSLGYVAVAGMLYWLGGRKQDRRSMPSPGRGLTGETAGRAGGKRRPARSDTLRSAAFAAGLATIVLALDSPLDEYADQLFWAHLVQHILLLTIAPPLILLGRPWPRMWRALPLGPRVRVGRTLARSRWSAPVRALASPLPAWLLFNLGLLAWHIPGAYGATLTSQAVHDCEHAMFFFTGLLFWAHVVNPGPLRPRQSWPMRVAYVTGAMIAGWVLAITLVMAPHPLYGHYAALAQRPGGISALTDQQIAAGMMWVPGSIAYAIAVLVAVWRWIEPEGTGIRRFPAMNQGAAAPVSVSEGAGAPVPVNEGAGVAATVPTT